MVKYISSTSDGKTISSGNIRGCEIPKQEYSYASVGSNGIQTL